MQYLSGEYKCLVSKRRVSQGQWSSFVKEHKVSWGHGSFACKRKMYWEKAEFLRANVKFHTDTQNLSSEHNRMQILWRELNRFVRDQNISRGNAIVL